MNNNHVQTIHVLHTNIDQTLPNNLHGPSIVK